MEGLQKKPKKKKPLDQLAALPFYLFLLLGFTCAGRKAVSVGSRTSQPGFPVLELSAGRGWNR
jgi:hypothetical protein